MPEIRAISDDIDTVTHFSPPFVYNAHKPFRGENVVMEKSCRIAGFITSFRKWVAGAAGALAIAPAILSPHVALAGRPGVPPAQIRSTTSGVVLAGVSCVSTSDCVAVGYAPSGYHFVPIARLWNGKDWADLAVPRPGTGSLDAVSCLSATFCMAVGSQGPESACVLAESFDGRSWTNLTNYGQSCQGAADYAPVLFGVSCTSSKSCVAAGTNEQNNVGLYSQPIGATWNGKSWSVNYPPAPADAVSTDLSAADCTGPSFCVAAGSYFSGNTGTWEPLVETWNGARWALGPGATLPAGGVLSSVSCTSSTSCVVAGETENATNLAESWNGKTLAVMHGTAAAGDSGDFNGISCTTASACLAVGTSDASWNGSTWTKTSAPTPNATLNATWCASPIWCVAVGNQGVIEFWNGASWSTAPPAPVVSIAATADHKGYYLVTADGRVDARGDAVYYGDMAGPSLSSPIVGIAVDPATGGYWLVGRDGGVFAFHAPFFGSTGLHLRAPIVGIAATPAGNGYRLVGSDGGIFDFGPGAHFYGSMGGQALKAPIVGLADDDATGGYWLVASDGGVFSFHARFLGSAGSFHLSAAVVGGSATEHGDGYRLVTSDGGVFDFGAAQFSGSLAGKATSAVAAVAAGATSAGYWLAQADGAVAAFGGAGAH